MGWTVFQRAPREGWQKYLDAEIGAPVVKSAVLTGGYRGNENYYAAVKSGAEVFAAVALIEGNGYKLMDESMGPYANDCPVEILDLLTPTKSEYANKWRARCRAVAGAAA